jgi:hypothetical protein
VNTTLQHLAIRPFVGLLAAFVLATSAVVAVSAETHAGKPTPTVAFHSNDSCSPAGASVRITANFKITSKGPANVTAERKGGVLAEYPNAPWYSERVKVRDLPADSEGVKLFMVDTRIPAGPHDGAVRIRLTDRSGKTLAETQKLLGSCTS